MLNNQTIERELQRSNDEHDRLKKSITQAERDAEFASRKIQIARKEVEISEHNLNKQKGDLEQMLRAFKYADEQLVTFKNKEEDYKRKITTLETQLRTILKDMEKDKRR